MRRSKAPSVRNKRSCPEDEHKPDSSEETYASESENETFKWGSKERRQNTESELLSKYKRIFNIVWRDVSSKKHKTWKGDGVLEVNLHTMKAVAKDETGKILGCSTRFAINELQQDYQMIVGSKEIEIQNEIKDEDEIYELRRMQAKNCNWGEEEYMTPEMRAEEKKKPKGGFRFKPLLVLKPLEMKKTKSPGKLSAEKRKTATNEAYGDKISDRSKDIGNQRRCRNSDANEEASTSDAASFISNTTMEQMAASSPGLSKTEKLRSFICFIKPAELQQYLFQQIREYCNAKGTTDLNSLELTAILQQICNHPSLIKHSANNNELVQHLLSMLPDWSEMGPFDSGKLEFLQYFMLNLIGKSKQNSVIIARNTNASNMIQGLCDFMHLTCLRIKAADDEEMKINVLNKFSTIEYETAANILLIDAIEILKYFPHSLVNLKIIVFEDVYETMEQIQDIKLLCNAAVYYLVTSFSIEEFLILPTFQQNPKRLNYEELFSLIGIDDSFCYVHTKIQCDCAGPSCNNSSNVENDVEFFKSWLHFANPFDDTFLKESDLENSSGNIVSVFCKRDP